MSGSMMRSHQPHHRRRLRGGLPPLADRGGRAVGTAGEEAASRLPSPSGSRRARRRRPAPDSPAVAAAAAAVPRPAARGRTRTWASRLAGPCLLLLLVLLLGPVAAKPTAGKKQPAREEALEGCERIIRSTPIEERGVHQISFRCSEGTLAWRQAEGAMRVTLRTPSPLPEGRLQETCVSLSAHLAGVVVSLETSKPERLQPLAVVDRKWGISGTAVDDLCVRTNGPAALFLETQPGGATAGLGDISLQYDVSTVNVKEDDAMEECRPCTDEEMLIAVCSMDFVVSGRMDSVHHSSILQQTTIDLIVNKMYRQKSNHFSAVTSSSIPKQNAVSPSSTGSATYQGAVQVPHKCGVRYGEGDFLFMGRMRLGHALLQCAPRLEDFMDLWRRSVRDGQNECVIDW